MLATLLLGLQVAAVPPAVQGVHLVLEVRPQLAAGTLQGRAVLTLANPGPDPASSVLLLLNRLLEVEAVRDPATGGGLPFSQEVRGRDGFERMQLRHVRVDLPRPLAPGGRTRLEVTYRGWLAPYTETGMRYVQDHVDPGFTLLRADAAAFPWPAGASGDFTWSASVWVPPGQVVASGGRTSEPVPDGDLLRWDAVSRGPVPFLLIAIAPYHTVRRGGLAVHHFPEDSVGARRLADRVERGLEVMARWFGPLGSAAELTIMEIPDGWGSQASLTAGIIQTAPAFQETVRLGEVYHELTHLWNAPDLDRPSPRWNEGLATFLQARLAAELDGADLEGALDGLLARLGDRLERSSTLERVPFRDFGRERRTDDAYLLGGVFFALLYAQMGEAAFDAAYGGLWRARGAVGVSTDDLVRAFAERDPSVAPLFDTWFETPRWTEQVRAATRFADLPGARP